MFLCKKELCQKKEDCIWTNGAKRQYCRTKKNKKEVSIKNIQTENYILLNYGKITNKKPIGGFDIDWTIIRPKSGKKMPKDKDDWMLMYENVPATLMKLSKEYQINKELFNDLLDTLEQGSLCALGGGLPLPVKNTLMYFEDEMNEFFN